MLKLLRRDTGFSVEAVGPGWTLSPEIVWIDLESPTRDEELAVERAIGVDLPTREEVAQIEPSSRLYQENGATFMTATLLASADTGHPVETPATFVLCRGVLVTIRYASLRAFSVFATRAARDAETHKGEEALFGLLDAVVERLAEILELTAARVEQTSNGIFNRRRAGAFEALLTELALSQSVISMTRTSMASLARLVSFAALAPEIASDPECREHLTSLQRDVQSLGEHAGYRSSHIAFLLEAALGLINIEQNGIIKFFSVVAVVFLPPTLVASIYGMNFQHMPELDWPLGYPMAIVMMAASAIVPLIWFRLKGWL